MLESDSDYAYIGRCFWFQHSFSYVTLFVIMQDDIEDEDEEMLVFTEEQDEDTQDGECFFCMCHNLVVQA